MQLKRLLLWITFTFSGKKAFIARNSTANFEELLDPFCHLLFIEKKIYHLLEKKIYHNHDDGKFICSNFESKFLLKLLNRNSNAFNK